MSTSLERFRCPNSLLLGWMTIAPTDIDGILRIISHGRQESFADRVYADADERMSECRNRLTGSPANGRATVAPASKLIPLTDFLFTPSVPRRFHQMYAAMVLSSTTVVTSNVSSPIPSPSITQTSPFLLLPGELRNRIYTFCIESKHRKLRRKPRRNSKFTRPCGVYGNLQYVCRQLHAEFRPFYAARTVVEVHQPSVNDFIATCYPHAKTSRSLEDEDRNKSQISGEAYSPQVQGNLRIIVYFGFTFDAKPLMRLCVRYPAICVDLSNASACLHLGGELKELFASISSGAFQLDVETAFESITIQCSLHASLIFCLRQGVEIGDVAPRIMDLRDWLLSQGAPSMNKFAVVLKSHTREQSTPPVE
jgi:hypothetical protein